MAQVRSRARRRSDNGGRVEGHRSSEVCGAALRVTGGFDRGTSDWKRQ